MRFTMPKAVHLHKNSTDTLDIYLVGGSVRDQLMGRPSKDHDYVVIGADEKQFAKQFPTARRVGAKQPVYYVGKDEYTLSAADSIEADLNGRDLTINAIARDAKGRIVSHPKALADLKQGVLRPVHPDNFLRDPVRLYRAARFAAVFPDFSVSEELDGAVAAARDRVEPSSLTAERIGNETLKACRADRPGNFLHHLNRWGLDRHWFEEIRGAHRVPAGPRPYHDGSVLAHIAAVMDRLAGHPLAVWMGLCHDLGKLRTDPQNWPHHYGHEALSQKAAGSLATRLRLSKRYGNAGMTAAQWHGIAGRYHQLKNATRVRLLTAVKERFVRAGLFDLVLADKGLDFRKEVEADWQCIRSVHLPEKWQTGGVTAGHRLHQMRCEALALRRI